jgi:hypothetical protein
MSHWRSVRRDGRMKTAKSRRTLELPDRCVEALRADHKAEQMRIRQEAGDTWNELGPGVLHSARVGTPCSQCPAFVPPGRERGWGSIPRSGPRASYERVYRKELRQVITRGARAINELFGGSA